MKTFFAVCSALAVFSYAAPWGHDPTIAERWIDAFSLSLAVGYGLAAIIIDD